MSARLRGVALLKLLEDRGARRLWHARPGVLHFESQHLAVAPDFDADAAVIGEIDRIADKIDQHLPKPRRIALHLLRRLRRNMAGDFKPLCECAGRE